MQAKELSSRGVEVMSPFHKRLDLQILRSLRRIVRAIDLHSRRLASTFKITAPQLVCLLFIKEHEPVSATIIAHGIHISPSTVIGILDRLEGKGLIQRERDSKDRRVVHIRLTEAGSALCENAPSPLQDKLAEALTRLSEAEQTRIVDSLDRIVELMEAQHISAAPILETGPISPPAQGVGLVEGQTEVPPS